MYFSIIKLVFSKLIWPKNSLKTINTQACTHKHTFFVSSQKPSRDIYQSQCSTKHCSGIIVGEHPFQRLNSNVYFRDLKFSQPPKSHPPIFWPAPTIRILSDHPLVFLQFTQNKIIPLWHGIPLNIWKWLESSCSIICICPSPSLTSHFLSFRWSIKNFLMVLSLPSEHFTLSILPPKEVPLENHAIF